MSDEQSLALGGQSFEDLKQTNEHGAEFWSARDIQSLLGYDQWRRFENAVQKAQTSCEQSGNDCDHHFAGAGKMVLLGSGIKLPTPEGCGISGSPFGVAGSIPPGVQSRPA